VFRHQQTLRGLLLLLTALGLLCLNSFASYGTVTQKKSPPNQAASLVLQLAPQDDLRFLFGAKFDAQKVVKSLSAPSS